MKMSYEYVLCKQMKACMYYIHENHTPIRYKPMKPPTNWIQGDTIIYQTNQMQRVSLNMLQIASLIL